MNIMSGARRGMRGRTAPAYGESERARSELADVIRRSIVYLGEDDAQVRGELARFAVQVQAGEPLPFERLDALFAEAGLLHRLSARDGWHEELLGMAAAYRVEAAALR